MGSAPRSTVEERHVPGLVSGSPIEGVELRPLASHADARGTFTEIFSADWSLPFAPTQWSVVHSAAGVLRGMHLHRRHAEYFLIVVGHGWVGLHDVRPGSPTEGSSCLLELGAARPTALGFPAGVVHGWCFDVPSVHVQAVSETYGRYAADDNLGCHWADPELGIDWPVRPNVVAPRAQAFPPLRTLLERTRRLAPDFAY